MSEIEKLQKQALIILLKAEIISHLEVCEPDDNQSFGVEITSGHYQGVEHYIDIDVEFTFEEIVTPGTYTQPKEVERTKKSFQIICINSSLEFDKNSLENELTDVLMQW